jgi:uncharacterized protein YraI
MNSRHLVAGAMAATLMAAVSVAQAQPQTAVTARGTNLRAGPATDYPVVAVLPAGFALAVQGCLPEYTWCDVVAGQSRGWMAAGNINYYYQNSYVPLSNYGAVLGIGALAFVLNDYWGDHYRNRPFYRDRSRWEGRHFAEPRRYPQQPGYVPQQRGYAPPQQGYAPRGGRNAYGAYVAPADQPRIAAPNAPIAANSPTGSAPEQRAERRRGPDPQTGATQTNPRVTRQQQREINQGGSSGVQQQPNY